MSNAIPAKDDQITEQTRFCLEDLTIRNRVLAFQAALDATADAAPVKDDMLAQFSREVDDLLAQLTQVEKQFGKNSPMAGVLREALESARCRKATRRIELGIEDEEAEKAKKPAVAAIVTAPTPDKAHDGTGLGWALLALLALDQHRLHMAQQQQQRMLAFAPATH